MQVVKIIFRGVGQVMFQNNALSGLLMLAGIAVGDGVPALLALPEISSETQRPCCAVILSKTFVTASTASTARWSASLPVCFSASDGPVCYFWSQVR